MRLPKSLETLLDYGLIEEVVRPLMSGKEAQVYLVMREGEEAVAKIYKDAAQRSFKNRADYTEGRSVRNSRDRRAIAKGSKYGREQDEDAWRSTEVDMIYRLHAAGVRVPTPYAFAEGVLVMELVVASDGLPAPRLGEVDFSREEATEIYHHLLQEVVKMLCAGVVHADLSDFNILLGDGEVVIIDFPQSISAAGNLGAKRLFLRDVANLDTFLQRYAPGTPRRPYGEEIWSLYERNQLTPETKLTGNYRAAFKKTDTSDVMSLIGEARRDAEEAARRNPGQGRNRRGRGAGQGEPAQAALQAEPVEAKPQVPMRRREVIIEKPAPPAGRGRPQQVRGDHGRPQQARGDQGRPQQPRGDHGRPQQARGDHGRPEQARGDHGRPQQARGDHGRPQQARGEQARSEHGRPQPARGDHGRPQQARGDHSRGPQHADHQRGAQPGGEQQRSQSSGGQHRGPQQGRGDQGRPQQHHGDRQRGVHSGGEQRGGAQRQAAFQSGAQPVNGAGPGQAPVQQEGEGAPRRRRRNRAPRPPIER